MLCTDIPSIAYHTDIHTDMLTYVHVYITLYVCLLTYLLFWLYRSRFIACVCLWYVSELIWARVEVSVSLYDMIWYILYHMCSDSFVVVVVVEGMAEVVLLCSFSPALLSFTIYPLCSMLYPLSIEHNICSVLYGTVLQGSIHNTSEWEERFSFYTFDIPIQGTCMYELQHCVR